MIHFECYHCGRKLRADDEDAGDEISCPRCEEAVKVPGKRNVRKRKRKQLACPHCGSDRIQGLQVTWETGTARINTSTRGGAIGYGFDTGPIFGGGSARTTGSHQTEAAKLAEPPKRKDLAGPLFLTIAGPAVAFFGGMSESTGGLVGGIVGGTALLIAGIATLIHHAKWNQEVFPGLYDSWLDSCYCLRCGEIWEQR